MKQVFILLYDGVQLMDFGGPSEVLSVANALSPEPLYQVTYVTPNASGKVQTSAYLEVTAQPFFIPKEIDLLILPGAHESVMEEVLKDKQILRWISDVAKISKIKASICMGCFFLGEVGLLKDRKVTTHWDGLSRLKQSYPEAIVQDNILYVNEGDIWTSAGITSGVDMMLAMVMKDCGPELALAVARVLVVYLLRQGGQAQFSMPIDFQSKSKDASLISLISWLETRLDKPTSVDDMAKFTLNSVRTLHRNCVNAFNMSPAQLLSELRLERGRTLLQDETLSVKQIAAQVGFNQTPTFSRAFSQRFGVSPRAYRDTFSVMKMSQE
ncbi:GlxA family transcriptional regulator [Litoribrevibacter euphylliae]|uniref:GlxA family transcriptional regulator n=1 Tax=Litoribrevibacter euphylliae TaxID=1834034 RepID=A0ABV7HBY6_9GAMM